MKFLIVEPSPLPILIPLGPKYSPQDSFPNIPRSNPKSLRSAYDVKAYVLLVAIRPSDGDVKFVGLLSPFQ